MAPAGVVDRPLMSGHYLWAPDEVLARPGPPSARQDLVGLPELRTRGASGLCFSRLAAAKADHRIRLAAIRGTSFVAPDPACPACLVGQCVIGPWLRGPQAQPLLPGQVPG